MRICSQHDRSDSVEKYIVRPLGNGDGLKIQRILQCEHCDDFIVTQEYMISDDIVSVIAKFCEKFKDIYAPGIDEYTYDPKTEKFEEEEE